MQLSVLNLHGQMRVLSRLNLPRMLIQQTLNLALCLTRLIFSLLLQLLNQSLQLCYHLLPLLKVLCVLSLQLLDQH